MEWAKIDKFHRFYSEKILVLYISQTIGSEIPLIFW